jgi:hypothetical protein
MCCVMFCTALHCAVLQCAVLCCIAPNPVVKLTLTCVALTQILSPKDHPKAEDGSIDWTSVDPRDTIVVFDADMMAKVRKRACSDGLCVSVRAHPATPSDMLCFPTPHTPQPDFFCKTLEVMADEELALCLTPQAFHNINADGDLVRVGW